MTPAPLKDRLEEVMKAKSWVYADLVRESGESRSVVSQWLGRSSKIIKSIGKMQAAERLESASGFYALWIAKGIGPKHVVTPFQKTALPPAAPTLADALTVLGMRLAEAAPEMREAVAANLAGWARSGGQGPWLDLVEQLLQRRPEKRQSNG